MLENKKVIIFDLDGTILDSVNIYNKIYAKLFKEYSHKYITPAQIQDDWDYYAHNNNAEHLFDGFLLYLDEKYSPTKHDIETLNDKYLKTKYQNLTEVVQYKKYVKEVLETLKEKGFTLVLATISSKNLLELFDNKNKNLYTQFKIYEIFDLVLTYEDVKERKPNPEVFLTAVEKLNVSKENCLIVEDSLEGVMAANTAGIDVLNIVDENMFKTQDKIDTLSTYKLNNMEEFFNIIIQNK